MLFAKTTALSLGLASVLMLAGTASQAQPIYRIVGPDGRVSFSDKPPVSGEKSSALGPGGRSTDNAPSAGGLPFEVREAMNGDPVTLYTGNDCGPCGNARTLLSQRGVPYTERTLTTPQDIDALKRLGMEASIPILTVGTQRLRGFAESEWTEYLDAAGYPKTSRLPNGYRNPAPAPLAPAPDNSAARTDTQQAPAAPAVPPPSGPTPSNPAGIVF